jgi:hypothetical protein
LLEPELAEEAAEDPETSAAPVALVGLQGGCGIEKEGENIYIYHF